MNHTTPHTSMSSPALTQPGSLSQRLEDIARARRAVLLDHATLPAGSIAPWIERSWLRCMNYGLQPHEPVTFDTVRSTDAPHA